MIEEHCTPGNGSSPISFFGVESSVTANSWILADKAHKAPRPEGAYLVDLSRDEAGPDWKKLRIRKSRQALHTLAKLIAGD